MGIALAILISAVLYRIPRGGPDGVWWRQSFGIEDVHGAWVWAIGSAVLLSAAAGIWGAFPMVALLLWLGEKPGYMGWVNPVRPLPLTMRGLLLLNPFMGIIYWAAERWDRYLPRYGVVMDGPTAWAELACGAAVAAAWFGFLSIASTFV